MDNQTNRGQWPDKVIFPGTLWIVILWYCELYRGKFGQKRKPIYTFSVHKVIKQITSEWKYGRKGKTCLSNNLKLIHEYTNIFQIYIFSSSRLFLKMPHPTLFSKHPWIGIHIRNYLLSLVLYILLASNKHIAMLFTCSRPSTPPSFPTWTDTGIVQEMVPWLPSIGLVTGNSIIRTWWLWWDGCTAQPRCCTWRLCWWGAWYSMSFLTSNPFGNFLLFGPTNGALTFSFRNLHLLREGN